MQTDDLLTKKWEKIGIIKKELEKIDSLIKELAKEGFISNNSMQACESALSATREAMSEEKYTWEDVYAYARGIMMCASKHRGISYEEACNLCELTKKQTKKFFFF